ncbi:DUF2282 domain-containing protein [Paraburkholderia sp. LEh10]|uniref:BufA1 family periplasmic bufferin-type metallophore n=1 Tax=Paraburkholderia sp. LEh10 TaxID=2821353 RepID=UPI001AE8875F|nr:DUF2282 domain-containing protein [Paraburkholderia sp. LEh10]MBP0590797.1 DUF2282 domain-containing protein [Paraburkholderia sp. LEh10]
MSRRIANVIVIVSALGAIAVAVDRNTHLGPHSSATFTFSRERCFGVVRAARNDCGTARHACAGRATRDAASDEWVLLPAGTCTKIVGGETRPASG